MNLSSAGLIAAYALLAALLTGVLLASPLRRWIKGVAVVVVSAFYFVTYQAVHGLVGWPTAVPLPERSLLLASYAIEPDRERGTQGILYVWADTIVDDRPDGRPRAYRLPYDAALHASLDEAARRSRNGRFQLAASGEGTPRPRADGPSRALQSASQELRILDLPDPRLPEK